MEITLDEQHSFLLIDTKNTGIKYVIFICCIFSISSSLIYLLLRIGYQTDYFSVVKVLGLALMLFTFPIFLKARIKSFDNWRNNYSFLLFLFLVVITVLGYVNRTIHLNIFNYFNLLGFGLFAWLLTQVLRKGEVLKIVIITVLTIFFSTFIVSILFTYHIKPLFFEDLFSSSYLWKVDTLYHIANSQMLNTYNILSTGLNGVEYMPYHYGANVLYVGLANFVGISLFDTYLLLPAVVTGPMFICTFLLLIIQIKKVLYIQNQIGVLFVAILFMAFIGFSKNTLFNSSGDLPEYFGMLLGSPILFVSDSYTISLIFMFIFFTLSLSYYGTMKFHKFRKTTDVILLIIVFPALFVCSGFSKISTLYILFSVIVFLFIRLKLYKTVAFSTSFLIIFTSFFIVFYFTRDLKYGDGDLSWLYNFKDSKQNVFLFILMQFSWFWLLLLLFQSNNLSIKTLNFVDNKRILLEVVLVMVLASWVPTFLVVVKGGQLHYFTEIHSWFAVAILLAYLPFFDTNKLNLHKHSTYAKKILLSLVAIYLVWTWFSNFRIYRNEMLRTNYSTRYHVLLGPTGLLNPDDFNRPSKLLSFNKIMLSSIRSPFSSEFFDSLRIQPAMAFIKRLSELNNKPLEVKRKSLVYVDFAKLEFDLPLKCYEKPLLIPALSGMASIMGGLSQACKSENDWFSGYGYEYYDSTDIYEIELELLKSFVAKKGFSWLYYYDNKQEKFIKFQCGLF